MNKYVKLIAKPDTWFKEGTEVFHYDFPHEKKIRITLDEYNNWVKDNIILCRGIRVVQNKSEEINERKIGDEYIDGESCSLCEFDIEILEY